jgi:hypothetical protein
MRDQGYTLVEYSFLLGTVIVAILFMSLYMRRAISGMVRQQAESIGERYEYGGKTISRSATTYSRNITTNVAYYPVTINGVDVDVVRSTTNIHRDDVQRRSNEMVIY